MKRLLSIVLALAVIVLGSPRGGAAGVESYADFPPFLAVHHWYEPAIVQGGGHAGVVYELYLLNLYAHPMAVKSLQVSAGGRTFDFDAAQVSGMMRQFGTPPGSKTGATITAGGTAVLFVWLPFDSAASVPRSLTNTIAFSLEGSTAKPMMVTPAPIAVSHASPVTIEPPLHGKNWYAGEAPSNDAGHRRTVFFYDGRPYIAQRFAIDYVECKFIAVKCVVYSGDFKKNESYFSYGQPIFAVARGRVVSVHTGVPDNMPTQTNPHVTMDNAFGNDVILDIGFGRYAAYAHMIPGSARVKLGDMVEAGQVIGRVGNSGNSSAPHLHFQIINGPRFLGSEGEPYAHPHLRVRSTSIAEDGNGIPYVISPKAARTEPAAMPVFGELVDFPR